MYISRRDFNTRQTLTIYADMPRGRKIKVSVVEAAPPLQQASVNTPEDESPTPPIEVVLGQGIESEAATAALQKHIDDFMSSTVATDTADDTYLNDEELYDTMHGYWNPPPPTATQVCSSSATFLEGELQNIGTIPAGGQPDSNGWYTTQSHSAPPAAAGGAAAAAGGADVRPDTPRPNFPTTITVTPGAPEHRVKVNRSHSDSTPTTLPHLISDDTTVLPKGVSSGKKRSVPNLSDEKKKKRQKKVKGSDINDMLSYSCIPLTAGSWPAKVNLPLPNPERVFYPQNAPNSQIEVYVHPNCAGVGVVQYVGAPYEKRLNMSVGVFKKLYELSGTVLEKWSEIQKDGDSGLTSTSNSFRADLDSVGFIQLLVTLYKGRPKIHIGTRSYINEIMAGTVGSQRQVRTKEHCGQTLGIHVMRDIIERVGRVLTDYPFHPMVINL